MGSLEKGEEENTNRERERVTKRERETTQRCGENLLKAPRGSKAKVIEGRTQKVTSSNSAKIDINKITTTPTFAADMQFESSLVGLPETTLPDTLEELVDMLGIERLENDTTLAAPGLQNCSTNETKAGWPI